MPLNERIQFFFWVPELMFETASFSLRSLFVFHPLVRGGGAENSSDSEVPFDEGTEDASLAWAGVS